MDYKNALKLQKIKTALNVALFIVLLAVLQYGAAFFEYNRNLILQGQIWRLITGHFVHYSFLHGLPNAIAAGLMALLFASIQSLKSWLGLILALSLLISLALMQICPLLEMYRGLSGLLHGVFMFGALHRIRSGEKFYLLGLCGLMLKLWQEWSYCFNSPYYSAQLNLFIAVEAHFLGAVFGFLAYLCVESLLFWRLRRWG